MAIRDQDQLALDETLIEDEALEALLEERLRRKVIADETRKSFEEKSEEAKVEIERLELPAGAAVRIGRFRLTRTETPARTVSFESAPSSRVSIKLIGED